MTIEQVDTMKARKPISLITGAGQTFSFAQLNTLTEALPWNK